MMRELSERELDCVTGGLYNWQDAGNAAYNYGSSFANFGQSDYSLGSNAFSSQSAFLSTPNAGVSVIGGFGAYSHATYDSFVESRLGLYNTDAVTLYVPQSNGGTTAEYFASNGDYVISGQGQSGSGSATSTSSISDITAYLHDFSDGAFAASALSGSVAVYAALPAAAQLGLNPISDAAAAGAAAASALTGALGAVAFVAYKSTDYYDRSHDGNPLP